MGNARGSWLKGSSSVGVVDSVGILPLRVAQGQNDGKNKQKQKQILRFAKDDK